MYVEREGKTWEDTAQEKCLLDKMTQTHSMNITAEGRQEKNITLLLCSVNRLYLQHRTTGK